MTFLISVNSTMCSTAVLIVVVAKQVLAVQIRRICSKILHGKSLTSTPPCLDKGCLSQSSHDLRVPNGYFTDSKRVNFNNMMLQFFEFVLGFNFLAKAICDFCKILEHFIDSTYFGLPIPKLLRYFDLPFSNTSLTKELN